MSEFTHTQKKKSSKFGKIKHFYVTYKYIKTEAHRPVLGFVPVEKGMDSRTAMYIGSAEKLGGVDVEK